MAMEWLVDNWEWDEWGADLAAWGSLLALATCLTKLLHIHEKAQPIESLEDPLVLFSFVPCALQEDSHEQVSTQTYDTGLVAPTGPRPYLPRLILEVSSGGR